MWERKNVPQCRLSAFQRLSGRIIVFAGDKNVKNDAAGFGNTGNFSNFAISNEKKRVRFSLL